jgi:hypothetical protein
MEWQNLRGVPIHVWHVFYDRAYGLSFDRAEELIKENLTEATVQTFQAPGGATTKKVILQTLLPLRLSTRRQHRGSETSAGFCRGQEWSHFALRHIQRGTPLAVARIS